MIIIKPKKRTIIYWFFEFGFFFLSASFFLMSSFLIQSNKYFYFSNYLFYSSIIIFLIGMIYSIIKWVSTKYFFLEKNLFIKDGKKTHQINYKKIKKIGYYHNLLQKILGSSNTYIQTSDNNNYFIKGVNYKRISNEILKKNSQLKI